MTQVRPEPRLRTLPVGRMSYVSFQPNWLMFDAWLRNNPWVKVEKVEEHASDGGLLADKWRFYIFTVQAPMLATWINPGFPDTAPKDGPGAVNTADDTVTKPTVDEVSNWDAIDPLTFGMGNKVADFVGRPTDDPDKKTPLEKLLTTITVVAVVGVGLYALGQVATIASVAKRV